MILTDKCKEDFEKWYYEKIHYVGLCDIEEHLDQTINSLIIEWFDSVDRINFQELYLETFKDNFLMYPILNIQEEAIKKCNEIYNKN